MSVLQKNEKEIRYLKRKNLRQESNIVGNYYRDIIRSYGTDVIYQKLDTSVFENYKNNIDQNILLQHAYGYNLTPNYDCSAHMICYVEVSQDIFQLNKYGLNPNTDVDFYFDSVDFACSLATKLGQFEEHKIDEVEFDCEVPACTNEIFYHENPATHIIETSSYVSADVFPYMLGLGRAEYFTCEALRGKLSAAIPGYELDKEYTVECFPAAPYDKMEFYVEKDANPDLYRSLKHYYSNDEDYLETAIFLKYKVSKIAVGFDFTGKPLYKYILHGKITGSVLFFNIFKIGKYLEMIHPEVGDLLTIDFPDDRHQERYEITDCYDKSLQTDGISPLLHKYVWKCKGRRYIPNDDFETNEDDSRMLEKKQFEQIVDEKIVSKISIYENGEDAAYGGYEGTLKKYDETTPRISHSNFEVVPDNSWLEIIQFECGSKLMTSGYELYFVTAEDDKHNTTAYQLSLLDNKLISGANIFESGLRFIKASDDCLVFVNISGETYKIVEDEEASQTELETCLNSMFDKTVDSDNINSNNSNFYKFKETRTMLWATADNLYCRLSSNKKLYKLV